MTRGPRWYRDWRFQVALVVSWILLAILNALTGHPWLAVFWTASAGFWVVTTFLEHRRRSR